jgi:uncharacterized membrane protein
MITMRTGVSLATSAALVAFASAVPSTAVLAKGTAANVHCYGINTCKGMSDCKTAHNDCKGMNSCKGQGFKELSAKQCKADGGNLTAPK